MPEINYKDAMGRLGGNGKLYITLLKKLNARAMAQDIKNEISEGRLDKAAMAAHTLKGASANLSLVLLAKACEAAELSLKAGMNAEAEMETLTGAVEATCSKIDELIASAG